MDAVVELLRPFSKRMAANSIGALILFWATGLLMFHLFHPQSFLICTTGGKDICGLLSGETRQITRAAIFLVAAMTASSLVVFSRALETVQFLAGGNWRFLRRPGVLLQARARNRAVRRAFPNREIRGDTADHSRPTSADGRESWRRYPHRMPGQQHGDQLQPTFLGNVFTASQQHVWLVDGLHLHKCWQILRAILPQDHLARLQAGVADLFLRAGAFQFSVATAVWAMWLPGWNWKAFWVTGWLLIAYGTYRGMCSAACRYCDSVEAIIILNSDSLYQKLGMPPLMRTIDQQRRRAEQLVRQPQFAVWAMFAGHGVVGCGGGTSVRGLGGVVATRSSAGDGFWVGVGG